MWWGWIGPKGLRKGLSCSKQQHLPLLRLSSTITARVAGIKSPDFQFLGKAVKGLEYRSPAECVNLDWWWTPLGGIEGHPGEAAWDETKQRYSRKGESLPLPLFTLDSSTRECVLTCLDTSTHNTNTQISHNVKYAHFKESHSYVQLLLYL